MIIMMYKAFLILTILGMWTLPMSQLALAERLPLGYLIVTAVIMFALICYILINQQDE